MGQNLASRYVCSAHAVGARPRCRVRVRRVSEIVVRSVLQSAVHFPRLPMSQIRSRERPTTENLLNHRDADMTGGVAHTEWVHTSLAATCSVRAQLRRCVRIHRGVEHPPRCVRFGFGEAASALLTPTMWGQ